MKDPINPTGAVFVALNMLQSKDWKTNLCEWIDNSLDWRATIVKVDWGKWSKGQHEFVRVADDGDGCEDTRRFFQLGNHVEHHAGSRVSLYGVGGTLAQCWACEANGVASVASVHKGVRREARCDYEEIRNTDVWESERLPERPAREDEAGTALTVRPCVRRVADKGERWDAFLRELGYVYMPALQEGKQIKLRRSPEEPWSLVKAWVPPSFEAGHIEGEISVGRRRVFLKVGVVKQGVPNLKAGLTYTYGFRALGQPKSLGCGDYSTSNISGVVQLLGKDWPVTTHKDDIIEGATRDALAEAVFDAIQRVLMAAQSRAVEMHVASLTSELSAMVNGVIAEAKAKRGRGPKKGSVDPTGEGSGHTRAENEQAGDRFPPKRGSASKYIIDWQDFGEHDDRSARFDWPKRIYFNTRHPWVAERRQKNDTESLCTAAIYTIAAYDKTVEGGQTDLLSGDGLMSIVGRLLKRRAQLASTPQAGASVNER